MDDVAPKTGEVDYGEYTNDRSPVIRVSLGDQVAAGETLRLSDNGTAIGAGITLTAAEVAQGYVDVPVSNLGEGWNLLAVSVTAADGSVVTSSPNFALGVETNAPAAPVITGFDEGDATHVLADGAHTSDTTPTLHIHEDGLPPPPSGPPGHPPYGGPAILAGHIQLYEGDKLVGDAMISNGDLTVTSDALTPGEHTLTAVAVDRAGNTSAASAPFHVFVDGPADSVAGGQMMQAGPGALALHGGAGDDTLIGTSTADMLRGGDGNDSMVGGAQFNDVNGNAGNDTIVGHSSVGDWLLGGQGGDSIDASQSTGHNILNGNIGADTLTAGSAGDFLRGGQGDDLILGGAGADWLSGDLGHNTLTGGGGADSFHAGAGTDLVTDFDAAHGDRVIIDSGLHFTAAQSGEDTVISLSNGGQMTLAHVAFATLPEGWIAQL